MKLSLPLLLSTLAVTNGASIRADSKAGSRLLEQSRRLNDNEDDMLWLTGYSLKFEGCHEVPQYNPEEADREEGGGPLMTQRLIKYQLCPSDSCKDGKSTCKNAGEYISSMEQFVQAYVEQKQEAAEQACETAKENCYCDNANDDQVCENECLQELGLDYCIENDDDREEFEVQEFMECREIENQNGNNNNNNNNNGYFVGPYCSSDGKSIHLGVFSDETCTTRASDEIYSKYNYGVELPYKSESIVKNDCVSCLEVQEENDNDQQQDDEVSEMCQRAYEESGKCETKLKDINSYYWYPKEDSCNFIHSVLPGLEKVKRTNGHPARTATAFAWLFGISSVALAAYVYLLREKLKDGKEEESPSSNYFASDDKYTPPPEGTVA
mmetsp:Transcript_21072/g.23627  ORF Transcript_21072/g.23627 Transcript_21072/m.23627 type:complete len:382 (-) Transcript_21072:159-1304(-)